MEGLALMTWLMPKDPRHGRVGSQDPWQEEEGAGQRPPYTGRRDTGKVVKLSCLCSKAICREIIPRSTDTCTQVHVHTSPELQRRAPCDGQRAGSGQPGFHGSSGPAGNCITTAFPPERLPDSFRSLILIQGPQEPGCIMNILSASKGPRP